MRIMNSIEHYKLDISRAPLPLLEVGSLA